jgi:pyrroloquinoline quinone biosynthesis protein B
MRVKILGSAAGGGFPQWNCGCANCSSLRAGRFHGKARTQTQVAISHDSRSWFLLGASPDLRVQIEATPELHPRDGLRQSPIAGLVLASADIDHVFGLLLLRELQPLRVYGAASILRILREENTMFCMLNRARQQAVWSEIVPGKQFSLLSAEGTDSDLRCEALTLGTRYPAYVPQERAAALAPSEASLGLILQSKSGRRLAFMPAVPQLDDAVFKQLESTDVLLFDGTFWSDDELTRIQGCGQTAGEMGHMPISSAGGSFKRLARLSRPRKIFLHINNTNPILDESSPEHRAVRDGGWEVAEDGWQFEL